MENEIATVVITAIVTGTASTIGTVAALKVHINYLRESISLHHQAITRAHMRLDDIEKRCTIHDYRESA